MKHARADYNRMQDPAGLIGADEPVFLVRAQDQLAPHMVLDYAARCEELGLPETAEACRRHAGEMFRWQEQHGKRLATVPGLDGQPAPEAAAKGKK